MLILQLALVSPLFCGVLLDCGCDKLKREETLSTAEETLTGGAAATANNGEENKKVCQKKARNNNRHYRDYYPERTEEPAIAGMSLIPGGDYLVGTDEPHFKEDQESPERLVKLKDFYMDKYEVSNARFQEFVTETSYTTEAERFGDSFIFKTLLTPEMRQEYEDYRVVSAPWWYKVRGISWQRPNGPESNLEGLWNHPVVHVSWHDAVAFCKWEDKRLPTEAEWEAACRGGKKRKLYPWGNKLMPKGEHWLNIWQGEFPDNNTAEDSCVTTCPVDKYRQNTYDLYNMVGNVWEWTQDMWHKDDIDANPHYVKKGGSYLCHKSYCYRYRCAARSQNTADSSAGNLGFRCAKDL